MSIFKGAGVAIVTPMKNNEEINYDRLEQMIEYQINQGTDCIIIAGTTGESSTLTTEEHAEVIKAAVKAAAARIPIFFPVNLFLFILFMLLDISHLCFSFIFLVYMLYIKQISLTRIICYL